MKLEIHVNEWEKVQLDKIARLIFDSRLETLGEINTVVIRLKSLRMELSPNPVYIIQAVEKEKLVGWLMLHLMNGSTVELNPGSLLKGHPVISTEMNFHKISSRLIEEAINWTKKEKFKKIDLTIPIEEEEAKNRDFLDLYGTYGFKKTYFCMQCELFEQKIDQVMIPEDFEIKQLKMLNHEDIYRCYYDAFNTGQSPFFFEQSETEKRDYFDTLLTEITLNEEASLAILKGNQLVGFTLVAPIFGETNKHLNCICIHPDFRKKGLGRNLLAATMKKIVKQGNRTMTLYTDVFNTRGIDLYQKNGFKEGGGTITYLWEE